MPVASLEAIAKARVAQPHWDGALKGQGLIGAFLYCRQAVHTTSQFHARMFAPDFGIAEDPATGAPRSPSPAWCSASTGCPTGSTGA